MMPDASWVDFPLFSSGPLDFEPLVPSVPQAGTQADRAESSRFRDVKFVSEPSTHNAQRTTSTKTRKPVRIRVESIREDESIARLDI